VPAARRDLVGIFALTFRSALGRAELRPDDVSGVATHFADPRRFRVRAATLARRDVIRRPRTDIYIRGARKFMPMTPARSRSLRLAARIRAFMSGLKPAVPHSRGTSRYSESLANVPSSLLRIFVADALRISEVIARIYDATQK
jgi:hypothetical protein